MCKPEECRYMSGLNISEEQTMLRSVKSLEGFAIGATDGTIGKVKDFYFDDQAWVIRYIVVDTSEWLGGRKVLVSPYAINQPGWTNGELAATVTKEQIKNSPSIDSDRPVSRQYERGYLGYYGYPYYWGGPNLWGDNYYPGTAWAGDCRGARRQHRVVCSPSGARIHLCGNETGLCRTGVSPLGPTAYPQARSAHL